MDDAHQFDAIEQSNVENDMGLRDKAANTLVRDLRASATYQRLLCYVDDDVVQSSKIFICSGLTGIVGNTAPNLDEILESSRPADDTRHGRLGATLIACACFPDNGFHIVRFSGTTLETLVNRGTQRGKLEFLRFAPFGE
jgi:hypothetical protein